MNLFTILLSGGTRSITLSLESSEYSATSSLAALTSGFVSAVDNEGAGGWFVIC